MAGTITVTTTRIAEQGGSQGTVSKYSIAWVSDASGDVNTTSFDMLAGEIVQVRYVPDSGGTAPTALYDVTMTDSDGIDILTGTGANLSATDSTVAVPAVSTYFRRYLEAGAYIPVVANAGNAKGGTIEVLVR